LIFAVYLSFSCIFIHGRPAQKNLTKNNMCIKVCLHEFTNLMWGYWDSFPDPNHHSRVPQRCEIAK
jgi:hypothetical protein